MASYPKILSLFSGIGMLDESVRLVFPDARTICHVEREAYAAAVLAARMEDQSLDEAPIWSDLGTFDGKPWRGIVDCITTSAPCQPYSLAGLKKGNSDKRSWGGELPGERPGARVTRPNGNIGQPDAPGATSQRNSAPIPNMLRIIGEVSPAVVFLENVTAWVRGSEQHFRPVGDELCRMGYEIIEPVFIAASDVGASHERERIFILAVSASQRSRWQQLSESARRFGNSNADGRGAELADTGCEHGSRRTERSRPDGNASPYRQQATSESERRDEAMANATKFSQREPDDAKCTEPRQDSRTDTCGRSWIMAKPAQRGQRELRQPSGSDGQPDWSDKSLANASARSERPMHRTEPRERSSEFDGSNGGTVADTERSECGDAQASGRHGAAGLVRRAGEELANAEDGAAGICGRRQGRPESGRGCENIFAPGPSDASWPRILSERPWLAPATQQGIRYLVNGNSVLVDSERADALRACGNSVVPLCAAAALIELLRRAGDKT